MLHSGVKDRDVDLLNNIAKEVHIQSFVQLKAMKDVPMIIKVLDIVLLKKGFLNHASSFKS